MVRTMSKGTRIRIILVLLASLLACSFPFRVLQPRGPASVQATLYAQLFSETPAPGTAIPAEPGIEEYQETPGTPGEFPVFNFSGMNIHAPADMLSSPHFETSQIVNFAYTTQSGDTTPSLAGRFGVPLDQLIMPQAYPQELLLPVGIQASIPNRFTQTTLAYASIPDSEVIFSPSAVDLDIEAYILQAGGYLAVHTENVNGIPMRGSEIISRLAYENSINPRLLLGFLEYRTNWVFGNPAAPRVQYPIGFQASSHQGLFGELSLVIRQLTVGYYGWRKGDFNRLVFGDQSSLQIYPELNAGTVATLNLFSKLYSRSSFPDSLYGPGGFLVFYSNLFGDPWQRAAYHEPVFAPGIVQPPLELPFPAGQPWLITGGPHNAWGVGGPFGGLDFAPSGVEPGCGVSRFWVTSSAAGLVTRSADGVLVVDLDGDGFEQTGWVLVYLHIADQDRLPVGTWVEQDDRIGHPSCEGGSSTGTHVHISRKYNGEWLGAGDPLPFVLSGWQAYPGTRPYQGYLKKGETMVAARSDGSSTALITR